MRCLNFGRCLLLLSVFAFMTACGGGEGTEGSRTVSGVVATGAPINGTVVLKDSNGVQLGPVNTDDDGGYSFDVTGLTPPFILKATGVSGSQNHTIYSVATGYGSAHITPFSNLVLQLATGSDPSMIFGEDGNKPNTANIDETTLKNALAKIKTLLEPILIEYGITGFDPITGDYSAIPDNKLDALLDVMEIKSENGSLIITNKLDGSIILSGALANITELSLDMAKCPDKSTLTDIKDITDRLTGLCLAIRKGENLNLQDVQDFFVTDPNYGTSNGHTRSEDVASIVTIFGANGTNTNGKLKSIRNVRLVSEQTVNYSGRGAAKVYLINYDFIYENGNIVHGNNTTWAKEASTGIWKFIGDPLNSTIGNNYGGFELYAMAPVLSSIIFEFDPLPTVDCPMISAPSLPVTGNVYISSGSYSGSAAP